MRNLTRKNAESPPKSKLIFEMESYLIRGACFQLYKELGYGHKEVVYQRGLAIKMSANGLAVEAEKQIPVKVNGQKVGIYTPDFVVNNIILLELKASSYITKHDIFQFWQYLRISPYRLGFLINFGKPGGVEIIRRIYDKPRI